MFKLIRIYVRICYLLFNTFFNVNSCNYYVKKNTPGRIFLQKIITEVYYYSILSGNNGIIGKKPVHLLWKHLYPPDELLRD
jgi:hypothetical protein